MKLTSSLAIALLTVTAALPFAAAPASAQSSTQTSVPRCEIGNFDLDSRENATIRSLEDQGYDVSGLETWNGCLRAFVTNVDGTTDMVYFDPLSLDRVGASADA